MDAFIHHFSNYFGLTLYKKFFYKQLLHIKIQSETMKVPPLPKGLLLKLKQMPPFFHCVENGWQNLGLRLFKNQG